METMTYNMTLIQNANSWSSIIGAANEYSGTVLMNLFIVAVGIIILFAMKRYPLAKALMATSWVCFILSLIFSAAGLVSLVAPITYLIIAMISGFMLFSQRSD